MPTPSDAKKALAALLREHGFRGSAPTFRKFVGKDFVAVVNLQTSGDSVYVNLGAHYRWLGKPSSWEKTKEYQCAFRKRLVDFAANDRFWLDDDASVTALLEMMKLEGLLFFEQLEPDRIKETTKALAKDGFDSFVPIGTPADAATWARVATRFGDAEAKKRFKAQSAAQEKAIAEERARRQAELDAEAVEMTYAELMAARKAGRSPKVVHLLPGKKTKNAAKQTAKKARKKAAKKARKAKASLERAGKPQPAKRRTRG